MPADEFQHFLDAQAPVYERVVQELSTGAKRSHWMWFIFPQLAGLGHSFMARQYALHSLAEAQRYAGHRELGQRLRECTRLVLEVKGRDVSQIFGYPDDLKFHSSLTLFTLAVPAEKLFQSALTNCFSGQQDHQTIELLSRFK